MADPAPPTKPDYGARGHAAGESRAAGGIAGREWTARELAELRLPGFPDDRNVFRRWLQKSGVPSVRRRGRGGFAGVVRTVDLPGPLQAALRSRVAPERPASSDVAPALDTETACRDLAELQQLPSWKQDRARARMIAVAAFEAWCRDLKCKPGPKAADAFAEAWRRGGIREREQLGGQLGGFCGRSLCTWMTTMSERGAAALAGELKPAQATIEKRPELLALAEAAIAEFPHLTSDKLHWILRAKYPDIAPSVQSCRRWLAAWKRQNRRLHAHLVNPDAAKGRYRPAFGDAGQAVTRLNQEWEFDDTPSDIVLADGQRYAVIGVIDVWSRRMLLQVHRTSTAHGISLLMRRALLTWGVPEMVRTDNGAAYVSQHITAVLHRLAIAHDILPPFSPEKKPFIERALKSFAYDLVEVLPGFVGHDVAGAQAIRARKTFAQRLFGRHETVELRMAPEAFQTFCDDWCDAYSSRVHGTLRMAPALKAASHRGPVRTISDERAIDVLLAPIAGHRTVTKKGVRVENGLFIAPQLGDLVGETVECRQDPADAGRLYVFDADGRFVCIAEDPDRTGVSRDEIAAAAKRHAQARLKERRTELRSLRRSEIPDPDTIAREILTARIAAAPAVVPFPRPGETHLSHGVEQAAQAARADEAPKAPPRTEADARREAKLLELVQQRRAEAACDPKAEREARITRLLAAWDALKAGAVIPESERDFLARHEMTTDLLGALAMHRRVDIRRGHYQPIAARCAASA